MSKIVLRSLAVLIVLTTSSTPLLAQRKLNQRIAVVPSGFVRIMVPNGSVSVVGWNKDSLAVTGVVHEPAGEKFMVIATPQGAKVGLWTESEQQLAASHITVYVPERSQVWVKTAGAETRVSGITGGLDLFSVSGSLHMAGSPREVYAETMGGRIVLRANTRSARLKTAAGSIHVTGSISDLTAVTVSGSIDVTNTRFASARLESVEGDIRYSGELPLGGALDIINHAGNIDFVLPEDVAGDFSINVYNGKVYDEFGVKQKLLKGSQAEPRELVFSLGDNGGARVAVRSFKGRISLARQ